ARRIAIVTGSEGGFAAEEAAAAAEAGAVTVGLGPRILRCETAPLAALAAVLTLTGDLE
ncbi:MAG TPA: RsmE family RNA methyltransferase, partial [Candidatus Gemmiger avicola]|nr:RsmE family RNA methyltransferase [Candidatus Gemmiger avicola]